MKRRAGMILGVIALVVAAYHVVVGYPFIRYDDLTYVADNPHVGDGLTVDGLNWSLTAAPGAMWHPLTWWSHMLDAQLFGDWAGGHHLTSAVLHALNAVLLLILLRSLTGSTWRSGMVAALFALHPINVEAVAWVAQRKSVLSASFWMLSLLAYAAYTRRGGVGRYLATFLLMALGLAAKPVLVTLPCVMLLLDVWPLHRLRLSEPGRVGPDISGVGRLAHPKVSGPTRPGSRIIVEKIPFFLLSAAASAIAMWAQAQGGAVRTLGELPLSARLANVPVAYVRYIRRMFWPDDLSIHDSHPALIGEAWSPWHVTGAALLLVAITAAVLVAARKPRFRFAPIGWLWFIGTLVPMIGLVQVGALATADRHVYIPLIGLSVMIVWGAAELFSMRVRRLLAVVAIAGLFALSTLQLGHWRSNFAVFWYAARINDRNPLAHAMLAHEYLLLRNFDRALEHAGRARQINPDDAMTLNLLAGVYALLDDDEQALALWRRATQLQSDFASAWRNLGAALSRRGRHAESVAALRRALELEPDRLHALLLLGDEMAALDRAGDAARIYRRVLAIEPGHPGALRGLERTQGLD